MKVNYKLEGTPNSPVLIFSNSLGSEMMMWDALVPYLLPYFRVLRYNTDPTIINKQPVTIDDLANQVIDLMDILQIESAYFCGLSMGGLIGQSLAIHHSNRFKKIVLSNTASKIGTSDTWNERIQTVKSNGFGELSEMMMDRWFTTEFRKNHAERVHEVRKVFLDTKPDMYISNCQAIGDADFTNSLNKINLPVLVITGDQDPVTNVAHAEFLFSHIKEAKLKILTAKHLASTELPFEYSEILINFFIGESNTDKGMHIRRSVLGDEHVNKSINNITEFNRDFQSFITKYAWADIWSRPGMSKRDRSLLTLSMLIALNKKDEFKMHVRAAFNNGVTKDELKELIMHSALYCGLPAANEAMHTAQEIINSL